MSKNYQEITGDISEYIAKLRKEIPDVMAGFSGMAQAATKEGALPMDALVFMLRPWLNWGRLEKNLSKSLGWRFIWEEALH